MSKRSRAEALENSKQYNKETVIKNLLSIKPKKEPKKLTYKDFQVLPIKEVRDRSVWVRKSHNKEKQIEDFIKFVYFKYEAPVWAIAKIKEYYRRFNEYLDGRGYVKQTPFEQIESNLKSCSFLRNISDSVLLECVQEGKGIKEHLKTYLNNKQIHKFLNSKYEEFHEAILDAYLPEQMSNSLRNFIMRNSDYFKFTSTYSLKQINDITVALINYLVKHNVDADTAQEIMDYIRGNYNFYQRASEIRENDGTYIHYKDFFKRSLNTTIQNSNDWHLIQQNLKTNKLVTWNKKFDDYVIESASVKFHELVTNRELSSEGNKMKHCVGSYARRCVTGETQIISMKQYDISIITIEVNKNKIVQVRGKYNRLMNEFERKCINEFASARKLLLTV